jgi:hypothetical protein
VPGIPEPPIRHFCRDMSWETLRQFALENHRKRQLCRNLTALKTPHICAGDTLRQQSNHGNRKSKPGCAQAVEDRTSLWKPQEKWKETRRREAESHCRHALKYRRTNFAELHLKSIRE